MMGCPDCNADIFFLWKVNHHIQLLQRMLDSQIADYSVDEALWKVKYPTEHCVLRLLYNPLDLSTIPLHLG